MRRKKQTRKTPKRRWLKRFIVGCVVSLVLPLVLLVALGVIIYRGVQQASESFVHELLPTVIERGETATLPQTDIPVWTKEQRYTGTSFAFSPEKPTVIVLVHGATRTPQPGGITGTLRGARSYWGYSFVAGLLGEPTLQTLGGKTLSAESWQPETLSDELLHEHILQGETETNRYVMLTYRDGSAFLGSQTANAVAQIYTLYQYLSSTLGEEPQLVLLTHSMGGLVGRYLLSNPETTHPAFALSEETRQRADFLRERTLYLVTLSAPHTGSLAADNALTIEKATALSEKILEQFGLSREEDPQRLAMGFLRAYQDSTQHLRTETLARLNAPGGLLEPHHARRPDQSLVPVYALSGRSPAGGFFDNPNVDLEAELTLLNTQSHRLGLNDKLLSDSLNMIVSDYMMSNFPGLSQGWGDVPATLPYLDKVRRYTPFKRDVTLEAGNVVPFEGFPTYYLNHSWQGLRNKPVSPANIEVWLEYLFPERSTAMDDILLANPDLSVATLRETYVGIRGSYTTKTGSVADGVIDSDGVVSLDSGLGLFLGTEDSEYFGHENIWQTSSGQERGSWYRIFDERYERDSTGAFPWEWGNHSFVQYSPEVASWLETHILSQAGPYVGSKNVSEWKPE
jgi:hypothetical protein